MRKKNKKAPHADQSQGTKPLPPHQTDAAAHHADEPHGETSGGAHIERESPQTWLSGVKKWGAENWEKIASIFVQATLAVFTYFLYVQATAQSSAAIKAAGAAERAVAEYRRANDLAERAFESNNESSQRTIDLTQKSVASQEQAVQDERKRFALENRSLLQISDVQIRSVQPDSFAAVAFAITNFGKQPIIIKGFKSNLDFKVNHNWDADTGLVNRPDLDNILIPAGKFVSGTIYSAFKINPVQYTLFMKNQGFLFLRGEVVYFDPISKSTKKYHYDVSPYLIPAPGIRVIQNQDNPIHNK